MGFPRAVETLAGWTAIMASWGMALRRWTSRMLQSLWTFLSCHYLIWCDRCGATKWCIFENPGFCRDTYHCEHVQERFLIVGHAQTGKAWHCASQECALTYSNHAHLIAPFINNVSMLVRSLGTPILPKCTDTFSTRVPLDLDGRRVLVVYLHR